MASKSPERWPEQSAARLDPNRCEPPSLPTSGWSLRLYHGQRPDAVVGGGLSSRLPCAPSGRGCFFALRDTGRHNGVCGGDPNLPFFSACDPGPDGYSTKPWAASSWQKRWLPPGAQRTAGAGHRGLTLTGVAREAVPGRPNLEGDAASRVAHPSSPKTSQQASAAAPLTRPSHARRPVRRSAYLHRVQSIPSLGPPRVCEAAPFAIR